MIHSANGKDMLPDILSVAFARGFLNDHCQQCIVDITVFIFRSRGKPKFRIIQGCEQFLVGKPICIVFLHEIRIVLQRFVRKEFPPESGLHVQQLANCYLRAFFIFREILAKRIVKIQFSLFPKLQDSCSRERLCDRSDLKDSICVYSGFPVRFNGIDTT